MSVGLDPTGNELRDLFLHSRRVYTAKLQKAERDARKSVFAAFSRSTSSSNGGGKQKEAFAIIPKKNMELFWARSEQIADSFFGRLSQPASVGAPMLILGMC